MNFSIKKQQVVLFAFVALALLLPAVAGTELLLWNNSPLLLLAGGGICAVAIGLFLLQRPIIALYVALFIYQIPFGLRPEAVDLAYTVIANGAIALAFCAWIIHAPFQRQPVLWNGVCFLIALYIVWAGVTLLWAPDIIEGRKKLIAYCIGLILLFLVVQQVRSLRAIDDIMRVVGLVGWMMVISGALTLLFTGYHPGTRLKVLDLNENLLGLILIVTLPGVIWPVLRSSGARRGLNMALSIVFILCTLILVLLSGSRGSALSLTIMLLAFWFWKPLRPWGIAGAVLAACMLTSAPFLLDTLNSRSAEDWGNELGGRDILWEASLRLIEDHPLTGAGVGNGPFALRQYIASLTSDYDHRDNLPSHNPFLEVGADTGILGMLLYSSILGSALWQFFRNRGRRYMRDGPMAAYFPLVLGSAVSYLASFVKGGGLENHPTFFLLLALLIMPSQLSHDSSLKTVGHPENNSIRGSSAPPRY